MLQRKLQNKYSKLKFSLLFISLLFFFISLIYYLYEFLKVDIINITSDHKVQTFKGLELIEKKNLLFLNTNKLTAELEVLNPEITKVKVKKEFPNEININYELKAAIAYIKANDGYLYLSENSKVINKTKELQKTDKLTELFYYQSFDYITNSVGSSLDFLDIKYSLSFLKKIKDSGFKAKSIDIDSPSMIRLNLGDATVIITTEKDIDGQLNNLDKIIKQFKVEGNSFSLLDLRFDKPIIRLN
ncbi:MAG: FtsQ-type POTRA domain-containing protein [Patescibacteria group bacterium]